MNDTPPEDFKNMEDILRKILSQAFGSGQLRPGMIGVNIIMAEIGRASCRERV
jgi:L-lactate utilization protein LutB